jgi:hypothetical protein
MMAIPTPGNTIDWIFFVLVVAGYIAGGWGCALIARTRYSVPISLLIGAFWPIVWVIACGYQIVTRKDI